VELGRQLVSCKIFYFKAKLNIPQPRQTPSTVFISDREIHFLAKANAIKINFNKETKSISSNIDFKTTLNKNTLVAMKTLAFYPLSTG